MKNAEGLFGGRIDPQMGLAYEKPKRGKTTYTQIYKAKLIYIFGSKKFLPRLFLNFVDLIYLNLYIVLIEYNDMDRVCLPFMASRDRGFVTFLFILT